MNDKLRDRIDFVRAFFRNLPDQIGCAGYLTTCKRPPERETIKAFCEALLEPFQNIAEAYGYDFSMDQPMTATIDAGSRSTIIITLQHKTKKEDTRIVDGLIDNYRTKYEILFTGRKDQEEAAFCNDGSLDYHMRLRPRRFAKDIVDIAEATVATFLDENLRAILADESDRKHAMAVRLPTLGNGS